jgi:PST family polysaccharide transporter
MFSVFVVSAFVVGLPWGAAGVAAAYAISTSIALPFRWWYLARVSPIRWRDNAALQLPYLAAGAATAFVLWKWPVAVALPELGRVALALGVSYVFAVIATLFTESGRLGLAELSAMLKSSLAHFRAGRALKAPRM